MHIWGLHILDVAIIFLYIGIILWLGKWAGRKTKDTDDFFLAGRKLGKTTQFFLNFGCSTNTDQAVAVTREIYRQGIGGMWIQFLVLFLTPFYWFTTFFFHRIQLTTIGDYFTERFNSKSFGASSAIFILLMSILGGGVGYMVAAKTIWTDFMPSSTPPSKRLRRKRKKNSKNPSKIPIDSKRTNSSLIRIGRSKNRPKWMRSGSAGAGFLLG